MSTSIPITSEMIEPFAALLIGRLYARVEEAKKSGEQHAIEHAYASLWWGIHGLEKIAVAVGTATHFSIANGNHVCGVARMIQSDLGIDPMTHHMWKA